MLLSSLGLPVRIEPTWADDTRGITDVEGLVSYDAGQLTLEYRSLRDEKWSPVRALRLALNDLRDVELKRSVFGWRIVLRVVRLALLEKVPGAEQGELVLRVARREGEHAANLVTRMQFDLSEVRLAHS